MDSDLWFFRAIVPGGEGIGMMVSGGMYGHRKLNYCNYYEKREWKSTPNVFLHAQNVLHMFSKMGNCVGNWNIGNVRGVPEIFGSLYLFFQTFRCCSFSL
jgi:hypothetical protein